MRSVWGGLLLAALIMIAPSVQAGEVEDLKREVQELMDEVAALRAEPASGAVEQAVEEYLASRASENGDLGGYMDGKFSLKSSEGDFRLDLAGGIAFDARFFEHDGMQNNTFDIELVRIKFSGQVGDGWNFTIQPEFSTGSQRLRDAYIQTNTAAVFGSTGSEYLDGISWKFGQFKMPFSRAVLENPYHMDTIVLPTMARAIAPKWDIGVQLSNTVLDGMASWYLAVSNGTNAVNSSDEFWYWGRAVAWPCKGDEGSALQNLEIGLSFGTAHTRSGESPRLSTAGGGPYGVPGFPSDGLPSFSSDNEFGSFYPGVGTRGRAWMAALQVLWFWRCMAVKAEFLYLCQDVDQRLYETSQSSGSGSYKPEFTLGDLGVGGIDVDDEVESMGGHIAFAYMLTGEDWTEAPSTGLEGIAQIEWGQVDPGGDVDEGDFVAYTLGVNYYFSKNARVMVNWVTTDFGDDTLRPIEEDGVVRSGGLDHNLLLRLQLTF